MNLKKGINRIGVTIGSIWATLSILGVVIYVNVAENLTSRQSGEILTGWLALSVAGFILCVLFSRMISWSVAGFKK